jgi:hypothetical protein
MIKMMQKLIKVKILPPAARGAFFEKTAPLDPLQKLLIIKEIVSQNFFVYLCVPLWLKF